MINVRSVANNIMHFQRNENEILSIFSIQFKFKLKLWFVAISE